METHADTPARSPTRPTLPARAAAAGPRPARHDSCTGDAQPPRLAAKAIVHIHTVLNESHEIMSLDAFKVFIRTKIRTILPHQMAVYGLGEIRSTRILRLLNVDFPLGYLQQIVRPDCALLDSPLKAWLRERAPITIHVGHVGHGDSPGSYAGARLYGITSLACHGVVDLNSTVYSYFVFGQLDLRLLPSYTTLLNLVVPHLHAVLSKLLTAEHLVGASRLDDNAPFRSCPANRLANDLNGVKITERERQVLQWIAAGKSNWEIGKILDISEFTAKNHVQNLLKKLSVTGRAQAVTTAFFSGLIDDDMAFSDEVAPPERTPNANPGGARAAGRRGAGDLRRARVREAS